MFDFIKGNVSEILETETVIEVGGIGYLISMPQSDIKSLERNIDYKIYTRLILRQDDIGLYGFLNKDERKLFDLLTKVTGVGPKGGLGIIGSLGASLLRQSILLEDTATISKAPGVGKKTANRICLELKDKISKLSFNDNIDLEIINVDQNKSPALEALISLGYNEYEAKNALKGIDENEELSVIIREALKVLGKWQMKEL